MSAALWSDPLLWVRAAIVFSILLFAPGMLEQFEAPKAAVVRTLGLGALAAVVASPRTSRRVRWQPLDLAVASWLAVEVLSTLFSVAPRLSLLGDTEQHEGLLTSFGLGGLYLAARWGAPDAERVRTTLHVAIAAAAAAGGYALLQATGLDPLRWSRTALYETGGAFMRPFGTLGHPNVLGVVSAATSTAALALAVRDVRRRWLMTLAAALLGTVTVLTLSRAAWLGTAAGVLVAGALGILLRPPDRSGGAAVPGPVPQVGRRAGLIIAALVTAVVLVVIARAGGMLRARFAELLVPGGGSARSRLEIWRTALACWRARPWLGHGPDTFALVFQRYQTPEYWQFEWATLPAHAHSIYLNALATRGVAGFAAGTALALALLAAAWSAWRSSAEARGLLPPLLGALVALAAAGGFGALGLGGTVLLVTTAAAVASLAAGGGSPERRAPVMAARRALLAGAIAAALALAWSAGDLAASRAAFRAMNEWSSLQSGASTSRAIEAADRAAAVRPLDDAIVQVRAETFIALARVSATPLATLAEAEHSARQAIRLEPLRPVNHQSLGNVLLARVRCGDVSALPGAEAAYARCLELSPCNALAMLQLADELMAQGRPRMALPLTQRAARLYPEAALAQALLGRTRLALGDRAGARQAFERAMTSDWHGEQAGPMLTRGLLDSLDVMDARSAGAGQSSRSR